MLCLSGVICDVLAQLDQNNATVCYANRPPCSIYNTFPSLPNSFQRPALQRLETHRYARFNLNPLQTTSATMTVASEKRMLTAPTSKIAKADHLPVRTWSLCFLLDRITDSSRSQCSRYQKPGSHSHSRRVNASTHCFRLLRRASRRGIRTCIPCRRT